MGKPAARLADMTAHGGTVVGPGVPTVLIGKMPAATMGDQHVCPMLTPGTPPIPHVGGPILLGSTGVLIGKKPAARVGDMAMCIGPPSQIVMGCFTVMIGEVGSGSQAGSAGAAAAAVCQPPSPPRSVTPIRFTAPERTPVEAFVIKATVKDQGGKPIAGARYRIEDPNGAVIKGATSVEGLIQHSGYSSRGSFTITMATLGEVRSSANPIAIGTETTFTSASDAEAGTAGTFLVNLVAEDNSRLFMGIVDAAVRGRNLEGRWTLEVERWKQLFTEQEKSFTGVEVIAMIDETLGISPPIPLDTSYRITVVDHHGAALANHTIEIQQPNGQTHTTRTGSDGKVVVQAGAGGAAAFGSHPPEASA